MAQTTIDADARLYPRRRVRQTGHQHSAHHPHRGSRPHRHHAGRGRQRSRQPPQHHGPAGVREVHRGPPRRRGAPDRQPHLRHLSLDAPHRLQQGGGRLFRGAGAACRPEAPGVDAGHGPDQRQDPALLLPGGAGLRHGTRGRLLGTERPGNRPGRPGAGRPGGEDAPGRAR